MKKYIALFLIIALLSQSAYGLTFTDLAPAEWAEPYIVDLAEMGIVNGYRDNTYRPLESVSHYAAILVVYRALDAQGLVDADVVKWVNRYHSVLSEYDVPSWPELDEAVAYAIEKRIIAPADLRDFMIDGAHVAIPRQKMALYMGRAWNEFLGEDMQRSAGLPFRDLAEIDAICAPSIALLYRHGIIAGDDKGYFNPGDSLNRAALAKLLITGIAELVATENVENRNVLAYVAYKLAETNKITFYDLTSDTKSYFEEINEDVEIVVDGKLATFEDLQNGQNVVLTYANDKLKRVRVGDYAKVVDGDILSGIITDKVDFKGARYLYIVDGDSGELFFYQLSDDVSMMRAGEKTSFEVLRIGDRIRYTLRDGGQIETIRY